MSEETKKHVSFSEVKLYSECSFRHHIEYTQGFKSPKNIHLVFGNAVHDAIDAHLKTQKPTWLTMCRTILHWCRENPNCEIWDSKQKKLTPGILNGPEWASQALGIYREVFSWLQDEFHLAEIVGTEVDLYEPIAGLTEPPRALSDEINFKGFIDIVLKDKDGIYHICDFKTTSWGWDLDKRKDTIKQYQLTLYKKFYCQKFNIPAEKVKTHFILLKRTPAKSAKRAELFSITSGNVKIKNANAWLSKNTKLMKSKVILKDRTSCEYCPWKGSEKCP